VLLFVEIEIMELAFIIIEDSVTVLVVECHVPLILDCGRLIN